MGIHEPVQGGEKVKNTLIWINEEGRNYAKVSEAAPVRCGNRGGSGVGREQVGLGLWELVENRELLMEE